ncbi:MAG: hypothetical protein SGJ09_05275 [Phycisphaerae bacterium]|nr:hypothetical protein [Phycisphaerae bacterium]
MPESLPLRDRSPILRWWRGVPAPSMQGLEPRRLRAVTRAIIEAAALPPRLSNAVDQVVARAGGFPSERRDVARELCAHFAAGVASGTNETQLLAAFGDPRRAGRLLKRAIRRKRGWTWHTWWWASRAMIATALFVSTGYGLIAWRFWSARPALAGDYLNSLNALAPIGPEGTNAWPILGPACDDLERAESLFQMSVPHDKFLYLYGIQPHDELWPQVGSLLSRSAESLDVLRLASRLPHLGAPWVPRPDANDLGSLGTALYRVHPRHAELMETAAKWLFLDARFAAESSDLDRAVGNVEAIVRLASLLSAPRGNERVVGATIAWWAATTVIDIVMRAGPKLSDADLHRLTLALETPHTSDGAIDLEGWRLIWQDLADRIFTDGTNGHITSSAIGAADELVTQSYRSHSKTSPQSWRTPAVLAMTEGRAEMTHRFENALSALVSKHRLPPWERPSGTIVLADDAPLPERVNAIPDLFVRRIEYATFMLPLFDLEISAAQTALAVERFRRVNGRFPDALTELPEADLVRVIRDPFDGSPLRYAAHDGSASLWSVGPDRTDEGGDSKYLQQGYVWHLRDAYRDRPDLVSVGDLRLWKLAAPEFAP